jgi:gas vesicle protein
MSNSGKILTAVVVGVAVGTALGILLAPDKGSETRRKINEQGKKLAEELKEKLKKGKEELAGLKDEIQSSVKDKVQEFTKRGTFQNATD